MDIEGNEWDALEGAKNLIHASLDLKCAICSYHSDFDRVLIEVFMDENGLQSVDDTAKLCVNATE